MEGYHWGEEGENGGTGTRNEQHKWQVQNRQGEVKNNVGNGEAKELICMTHGHELNGRDFWKEEGTGWRGAKGNKLGQLQQHSQYNIFFKKLNISNT